MNERIRELVRQAGLDDADFPIENWDNVPLAKFAELIAWECVNAVMDGTKEGDHYAQKIEQHFDNGTGGIVHFGVEE